MRVGANNAGGEQALAAAVLQPADEASDDVWRQILEALDVVENPVIGCTSRRFRRLLKETLNTYRNPALRCASSTSCSGTLIRVNRAAHCGNLSPYRRCNAYCIFSHASEYWTCECGAAWHCPGCHAASLRVCLLGPITYAPAGAQMELALDADKAKVHLVPDGPDKRQWMEDHRALNEDPYGFAGDWPGGDYTAPDGTEYPMWNIRSTGGSVDDEPYYREDRRMVIEEASSEPHVCSCSFNVQIPALDPQTPVNSHVSCTLATRTFSFARHTFRLTMEYGTWGGHIFKGARQPVRTGLQFWLSPLTRSTCEPRFEPFIFGTCQLTRPRVTPPVSFEHTEEESHPAYVEIPDVTRSTSIVHVNLRLIGHGLHL